jgi:CRISPR-associated endonuclease Csn1
LAKNRQKLAEYLADIRTSVENPQRRRAVGQTRQMVEDEFDALWQQQERFYPAILTEKLRERVEDVALAQRPTYFRRRTFGQCDLEPGEERALKAEWLTQRFEMLQLVNALRLEGGNQPPLDAEQRQRAIAYLESVSKPTWAKLRDAIGLPRSARFTHERGQKETVRGNATEAALFAALGEDWKALSEETRNKIRAEIGQAWHRIEYKPAKNGAILEIRDAAGIAKERENLARRAETEWGLTAEQAEKLARIDLPDGTARHSLKAMQKMLPYLEQGEPYMTALQKEYAPRESGTPVRVLPGPNPSELQKIEDPYVKRQMEKLLSGIRNPTVLRTLGELQKVVNTLLRAYGRPDEIRLEFARDLKQSVEKRREIERDQSKREKAREAARKKLRELGKAADGPEGEENVLRLLLWEEQGGRSPYSGEQISCADALSAETTEIDHIFPRSRSFDNSQANKVLCFVKENREKGNKTPYEWLSPQTEHWQYLIGTVWPQMVKDMKWPDAKRRRCAKPSLEEADSETFTNRQLVDTAFISRAAREYLGLLYGGGQEGLNNVQPVAGRATALLRRMWGIGLGRILDAQNGADVKLRDDLRHHAIDALVVALTKPSTVQALSRYWQVCETTRTRPVFPLPWPEMREQAKAAVEAIVVSHRVQAKLTGPLHEETAHGWIQDPQNHGKQTFVKREDIKELTKDDVQRIVDPVVKKVIENALGGEKDKKKRKEILAKEIRLPRRNGALGPVIRRVRIRSKDQDRDVFDQVHPDPKRKQFKTGQALHHIAIIEKGKKTDYRVGLKRDCLMRAKSGKPIAPENEDKNAKTLFILCRNDAIRKTYPNGDHEIRIVKDFYRNGQIFTEPHYYGAKPTRKGSMMPARLIKNGWEKVVVDPIGRVMPAR